MKKKNRKKQKERKKERNHSLGINRTRLPPRLPEGKLKIICDFYVAYHAISSPQKMLHKFCFQFLK